VTSSRSFRAVGDNLFAEGGDEVLVGAADLFDECGEYEPFQQPRSLAAVQPLQVATQGFVCVSQ
jgi:hypothetical protein